MRFFKLMFFISVVGRFININSEQSILAVVLMVKNEENVICQTLEPFVIAGVDSYLIFDTGSTDNTISVVKDYFTKHVNCKVCVFQEPFVDFSTSRNRALDLAEESFPNTAFFVMPDAEWYMQNVSGLMDYLSKDLQNNYSSYDVRITNDLDTVFSTARVITSKSGDRFVYPVHENLKSLRRGLVPENVYFLWRPSEAGEQNSLDRKKRDISLLKKELDKNPDDIHSLFFIGQSYESIGDLRQAYQYYLRLSKIKTGHEFDFITMYRLGKLTSELSDIDDTFSWDMAFKYFSEAISLAPNRAEPLVDIAKHYYLSNKLPVCYMFARRAMDLVYPPSSSWLIYKMAYDVDRYKLVSGSAWSVGEFEMGKQATIKALQALPNDKDLLRNLEYYTNKLMTK